MYTICTHVHDMQCTTSMMDPVQYGMPQRGCMWCESTDV